MIPGTISTGPDDRNKNKFGNRGAVPPVIKGITLKNDDIVPMKPVLRARKNKKGQTLVEYALILAFVSVVAISVLVRLGDEIKTVFSTITSQLAIAGSSH